MERQFTLPEIRAAFEAAIEDEMSHVEHAYEYQLRDLMHDVLDKLENSKSFPGGGE